MNPWLNGLEYLLNALQVVRWFFSSVHSVCLSSMHLANFMQSRFIFFSCHRKFNLYINFFHVLLSTLVTLLILIFNFWLVIFFLLYLLYEVKDFIYGTICICTCCFVFFFSEIRTNFLSYWIYSNKDFENKLNKKSSNTKKWGFIFRNSGKYNQITQKKGKVMFLAWHFLFLGLWRWLSTFCKILLLLINCIFLLSWLCKFW